MFTVLVPAILLIALILRMRDDIPRAFTVLVPPLLLIALILQMRDDIPHAFTVLVPPLLLKTLMARFLITLMARVRIDHSTCVYSFGAAAVATSADGTDPDASRCLSRPEDRLLSGLV